MTARAPKKETNTSECAAQRIDRPEQHRHSTDEHREQDDHHGDGPGDDDRVRRADAVEGVVDHSHSRGPEHDGRQYADGDVAPQFAEEVHRPARVRTRQYRSVAVFLVTPDRPPQKLKARQDHHR
jgi:hypothetical protein